MTENNTLQIQLHIHTYAYAYAYIRTIITCQKIR